MKRHTPLELELIEEGGFLQRANADLMDVQKALLDFKREHKDAAKGAKATLTIQVTLICENPKEDLFSIKAQTKRTVPARPATVSLAVADEAQDGTPTLFVRRSGSDDAPPAQGKLCTDDGRKVDQETGEAVPQ
jgi:hypothetical protein